jgi:histidinol dehydrogenase
VKIYQWGQQDPEFQQRLAQRKTYYFDLEDQRQKQVEQIFKDIIQGRDQALFDYTAKFEGHKLTAQNVRVSRQELKQAWKRVPARDRRTISLAASRIERFHKEQRPRAFRLKEKTGTRIEQRVVSLERVGIYIPAGRSPLFSTVLMTAIPAKIAGVQRIVMISPWPKGEMNPYILTAARMVGVHEIYKIGGAQGIFALAYGTQSIPWVNKIVGPGSIWVSEAKALVARMGYIGIDMVAGPSEIMVLADGSFPADLAAADLLSQLEHGEDSMATLVTTSKKYAAKVRDEMTKQSSVSGRKEYFEKTLQNLATLIWTRNLEESIEVVNRTAPEHLEILAKSPRKILNKIKNAASIFLGPYSPVPIGDYLAGPNHVLPTAYRAKYASPLGVEDFVKRQSVVEFSKEALLKLGPVAERMAELEGLDGHAQAIRIRREALAKEKPRRKRGRK